MIPDLADGLASIAQSQIVRWKAELEVLRRDPRVKEFTELRQKIDEADTVTFESRKRLGIPDNELSAFKADDLEDLVVRFTPAPLR